MFTNQYKSARLGCWYRIESIIRSSTKSELADEVRYTRCVVYLGTERSLLNSLTIGIYFFSGTRSLYLPINFFPANHIYIVLTSNAPIARVIQPPCANLLILATRKRSEE